MPLSNLRQTPELDRASEPDPFNDPRILQDYKMDALQPELTPLHPDWVPTVFYAPNRFPNEVSCERILRHYAQELPGRDVCLTAVHSADLSRTVISKYPLSEEIFRRRGFVSDVEVTSFDRKDHHAETLYLARNKAASCLQLALIDHFLNRGTASTERTSWREAQLHALHGGSRRLPLPLVEREGVFLPAQELCKHEAIHLAYVWATDLALAHGHRDDDGLLASMPDELLEQIQFERRHSRRLFGVRPAGLLLWQAQALAALRKTVWQVELLTGTTLNKQQAREAKLRARALKAVRRDRGAFDLAQLSYPLVEAVDALRTTFELKLESINEARNDTFYGEHFGSAEFLHGVSTELNLVAALHGATYCPRLDPEEPGDREDPIAWLQPLALWIGELKRQRTAMFDETVAASVLAILAEMVEPEFDNPDLVRYAQLLLDRLGEDVWTTLAAVGEQLLEQEKSQPIVVVYDWTRDMNRPWHAEQRADGTVVIEGPLLDFPLSRAAFWNEKANIIQEEKGLVFGNNI